MFNCKWLPPIIELTNVAKWETYQERLYQLFVQDFVIHQVVFKGKNVYFRKEPFLGKYEHIFIHLTHEADPEGKELNDRIPDVHRAERLPWNRAIIENYDCIIKCDDCSGVKYFEEKYKNTKRIYLWFEEVDFVVILEERKNCFFIITGFVVKYEHQKRKFMKKYNNYFK